MANRYAVKMFNSINHKGYANTIKMSIFLRRGKPFIVIKVSIIIRQTILRILLCVPVILLLYLYIS